MSEGVSDRWLLNEEEEKKEEEQDHEEEEEEDATGRAPELAKSAAFSSSWQLHCGIACRWGCCLWERQHAVLQLVA